MIEILAHSFPSTGKTTEGLSRASISSPHPNLDFSTVGHRLGRINEKVPKHLLHLVGVDRGVYLFAVARSLDMNPIVKGGGMGDQIDSFFKNPPHGVGYLTGLRRLCKKQKVCDQSIEPL